MKIFNKSEWKKVKLGDVCEIITGNTPLKKEKEYWDKDEVPFITPSELKYEGINYITPSIFVSKIGASQGRILPKNSICVCCIGSLGKLGILKEEGITNQQINSLVLKDKNVDLLYLYFYLKIIKNNLEATASSTTVKIVNKSSFGKIEIKLPNIKIQKKISKILELLENNIDFRKNQLNYLKELNKSLFRFQFFSSGKNFQKKKLKDNIIEMFIGPFGSDLKNEIFVDKEKGYCMVYEQRHAIKRLIDNDVRYITKEKYESLKRFKVEGGDIIVSCRGTIGKIYALPNDAEFGIIHSSLMKIKLKKDKYNNTFFEKLLEKYMQENIYSTQGSSIKMAITAKKLSEEYFIIPPIELQNKFAERVEKIEKLSFEIEKSIKEAENLYNSLMSKYFE